MFKLEQFSTKSLQDERVLRILAAAFNAVDPYSAVKRYLNENPIPKNKRTFAFGLGKAAIKMTQAIADSIPLTESLVITKHASSINPSTRSGRRLKPATVILGNHPIPNSDSLVAGRTAFEFVSQLNEDDLLICLISGGGSALMTLPVIPLDELQTLTSALLASGARIDEINTIRRHLDLLKGGRLAKSANGAQIISLILSDVVGDSIQDIASGPTAPDESTVEDAVSILKKYKLWSQGACSLLFGQHTLLGHIAVRLQKKFKETLKPNDIVFKKVENHIIASNSIALNAAKTQAEQEGFTVKIINNQLQGEACEIGKEMALLLKEEIQKQARPFCLLAGGETTVTLNLAAEESAPQGYGDKSRLGKGGRNQEVVLGAVNLLSEMENVMIISIATDGEDGVTDAAGAVATNETAQQAELLKLNITDYLSQNDAFSFFEQLDDLIKTGSSGTNVNDIVLCFAF